MQNLSPKDIAGSDIMELKVSWRIYPLQALKSFNGEADNFKTKKLFDDIHELGFWWLLVSDGVKYIGLEAKMATLGLRRY